MYHIHCIINYRVIPANPDDNPATVLQPATVLRQYWKRYFWCQNERKNIRYINDMFDKHIINIKFKSNIVVDVPDTVVGKVPIGPPAWVCHVSRWIPPRTQDSGTMASCLCRTSVFQILLRRLPSQSQDPNVLQQRFGLLLHTLQYKIFVLLSLQYQSTLLMFWIQKSFPRRSGGWGWNSCRRGCCSVLHCSTVAGLSQDCHRTVVGLSQDPNDIKEWPQRYKGTVI